jgi:hypothetical protein
MHTIYSVGKLEGIKSLGRPKHRQKDKNGSSGNGVKSCRGIWLRIGTSGVTLLTW